MNLCLVCLRCVFPTLQKNDSPFQILPQFLTVLGKKIDQGTLQQDCLMIVVFSIAQIFFTAVHLCTAVYVYIYIYISIQKQNISAGKVGANEQSKSKGETKLYVFYCLVDATKACADLSSSCFVGLSAWKLPT